MEICIHNNKKDDWNQFVIENNGSFLQSFEWGELQEKAGNKVFRIQAKEGSQILAQASVIHRKLPLGLKSYFYIPYGPCFKSENALKLLFQRIKDLARKQSVIFLRVEPLVKLSETGSREALVRIQPQKTLLLDLKPPEGEILQNFPKATRYSIRTAEKKGVAVEFRDEYTPEFYKLLLKTAGKAKFRPHTEEHYKRFFDVSGENLKVKLCLAKHQGKVIAASVLVLFSKTATYLHATSDTNFNSLQAPSFLMWQQIKLAKQMGCEVFDFWGIDEKKWPGVTHFKKSFGGREVEYPQGRDIVFQKNWYKLYKAARKLKA